MSLEELNEQLLDSKFSYFLIEAFIIFSTFRFIFLFIALNTGNIEEIKELIEKGANIETKDTDGCNPLMLGR